MSVGSGRANGAREDATETSEAPKAGLTLAAPSKDLVDVLMRARRERKARQVRSDCVNFPANVPLANGDRGNVNGHPSTAPAQMGLMGQVSDTNEEGSVKLQAQSVAHLLLRILALSYIVPLCDTREEGQPDKQATRGYTCHEAVVFMKSLLLEQPGAVEHIFKSRVDWQESSANTQYESTTLDLWLIPRIITAMATLSLRSFEILPGQKDETLRLEQDLMNLAEVVFELSLKASHQRDNSRLILTECIKAALRAIAFTGRASFLPSMPPPIKLVPKANSPKNLVSFFAEQADHIYRSKSKPYGDGINRQWMREDHSTFITDLQTKDNTLQVAFARSFLLIVLHVSSRVAQKYELVDLRDTIQLLLLSSWQWESTLDDGILTDRATPNLLKQRRVELASTMVASGGDRTPLSERLKVLMDGKESDATEVDDDREGNLPAPTMLDLESFKRLKKLHTSWPLDFMETMEHSKDDLVLLGSRLCCASAGTLQVLNGAIHCRVCDVPIDATAGQETKQCQFEGMPTMAKVLNHAFNIYSHDALVTSKSIAAMLHLCRRMNHSTPAEVKGGFKNGDIARYLKCVLRDQARRVRLMANKVVAIYIAKCIIWVQEDANPQARLRREMELITSAYEQALRDGKAKVKETAMLGFGRLCHHDNLEVKAAALIATVSQLGSDSLQKSLAYTIITELANSRRMTVFQLLAPYLDRISVNVIDNIHSTPTLFLELLQITNQNQAKFLQSTLQYTLPRVLETDDGQTLSLIARGIGQDVRTMCFNTTPAILKHFLVKKTALRDKGINKLIETVKGVGGAAQDITLRSLLKSYSVELLGHLVTRLGDAQEYEGALRGLYLMDSVLNDPQGHNKSVASKKMALATFLNDEILAILSWINDELMNGHGKKTISQKIVVADSVGALINLAGQTISAVTPQLMATMNTTMQVKELILPTLRSWHTFITSMAFAVIGPFIGQTAASLVASWPRFGEKEKEMARQILTYIVIDCYSEFKAYLLLDFPNLEEIRGDIPKVCDKLASMGSIHAKRPEQRLQHILDRAANENSSICGQALTELKTFLIKEKAYVERITSGNTFDPVVGKIVQILFATLSRDDETESLRDICLENMGILGAVDPDRFKHDNIDHSNILLQDFNDKDEVGDFAVHLIKDVLVNAFKATNDTKHQAALAYAIQELLKFAGFSASLLGQRNEGHTNLRGVTVALRVRQRWAKVPREILDTIAPLLESKYNVHLSDPIPRQTPIYHYSKSYKDWLQQWTNELIIGAKGEYAKTMFGIFRSVIRDHDLSIAQYILPHLVLNILVLGSDEQQIQLQEEIVAVLEDQVNPSTTFEPERRLLSAQIIFALFDHMSVWIRTRSQSRNKQNRRVQGDTDAAVSKVENLINAISQELMAFASLKCRAYARSLLNFEERIRTLKKQGKEDAEIQDHYANMHLIYANLDEPDGMEGISTCVLSPSLEHQIREHESTGRWTSAQSCWEVKLQENPDDLELHLGLLRCLRNLGHYDTMRTHVKGVLANHPDWEEQVDSFYLEGCCILSDWKEVERRVPIDKSNQSTSPAHATARVLLAMYQGDQVQVRRAIKEARLYLGKPLLAAGKNSYMSVYDSVTQLHMLYELAMISEVMHTFTSASTSSLLTRSSNGTLSDLSKALSSRLDSTLPSFRTREPLLSVRRSAFSTRSDSYFQGEIGQSWINSSKIARRSGHLQTAYSAALQASQWKAPLAFVQQAKLLSLNDQSQAALQEMQHAFSKIPTPSILSKEAEVSDDSKNHSFANARLLRARLADQAGRSRPNEIIEQYKKCTELDPNSEKMWYYLGHYYDRCSEGDSINNIMVANVFTQHYNTCRYLLKSATFGTKFFYRSLPRVLTLWFDCGNNEDVLMIKTSKEVSSKNTSTNTLAESKKHTFRLINENVSRYIERVQAWQWLAVFPQLVSRMTHKNESVWKVLLDIICYVAEQYPNQAMWTMIAGSQSTDVDRKKRFDQVISKIKSNSKSQTKANIIKVVDQTQKMAKELLYLCEIVVPPKLSQLVLPQVVPQLSKLAASGDLILPLQSSISVTMPGNYKVDSEHRPFPKDVARIIGFDPKVDVMTSLQRPRKLIILASDGKQYPFLCKPKDDLRKDARLMEFDTMINNLLQSNPESRKRRLYIRTYSVITLNEECGLIEWVPNTIGLRHILGKLYRNRDIPLYTADIQKEMDRARLDSRNASEIFEKNILSKYPPIFHEWFIISFPEPSVWLKARLAYAHTLAVMSMVGYVLGLGDRHGENILFDSESGDTVHVDLNCLFDKGSLFEIPERVPFRLTQNLVDALGVTGYEGVFRRAAEISMGILRDNKDSLMSVLEAMLHDPLVEWGIDERGKSRMPSKTTSTTTTATTTDQKRVVDPRLEQAKKSLNPVREKLNGKLKKVHAESGMPSSRGGGEVQWTLAYSTNSLVDALVRDATSKTLLAQMYVGWGSYL